MALMCIFRKRAFSVSRGFEDMVIDDEKETERGYVGQVDLEGKPVYRYYLVGFWAGARASLKCHNPCARAKT